MRFDLPHPRQQLVQIMDRMYRYGLTTTSGGNLSILDESGDLWITPAAVDKGNLQPDDIMCLSADGQLVGRIHPPASIPSTRRSTTSGGTCGLLSTHIHRRWCRSV